MKPYDYLVGTHRARWLEDLYLWPEKFGPRPEVDGVPVSGAVPLFLSAHALLAYKKLRGDDFPKALVPYYATDSGAFTHLDKHGEWTITPDEYGGAVYRFAEDTGRDPLWAAPQDWPCEPPVLRKTGMTVRWHQEETLRSTLYLRENFPAIRWIYVLQGYRLPEYLEHVEMHRAAGIDLTAEPLVGLGSICRRQSSREIETLVTTLTGMGIKLHGFGVSQKGLAKIGHLLTSADSMAWSKTAVEEEIRLDSCLHAGTCQNCPRWALQWRRNTLAVISRRVRAEVEQPQQLGLDLGFVA